MKKLLIVAAWILVSGIAQADQCEDLAQKAAGSVSGMQSGMDRKYAIQAMQALGCGGGGQQVQQQAAPVQSPPQYVPSIGQWCQVVNGVTNCWR